MMLRGVRSIEVDFERCRAPMRPGPMRLIDSFSDESHRFVGGKVE
jgi:hypothetical protein